MATMLTAHGAEIPAIGFGTWPMTGRTCVDAVAAALAAGYRHIDTAAVYGNEADVGEGIRQSGVARGEVFITTKIWPDDFGDMGRAAADSVARLGIDAADLILAHWPRPEMAMADIVGGLNAVKRAGLARHIGVSNFNAGQVRAAWAATDAPLVAHQFEIHPYLTQAGMLAVTREFEMIPIAYCPIGRGRSFGEPAVLAAAERVGRSPAQVVLRWHVQQGVVPIPKSETPARIAENFDLFDFSLSDNEVRAISGLAGAGERICRMDGFQTDWDG